MNKGKNLGNIGEEISCEYLEQLGYQIIERNFYCKQGEIDIIAKEKNEYVFVEVKTRSSLCYGRPSEAVSQFKQKHMYKTARYYLYINRLNEAFVRFDVIEVYLMKDKYKINHLKNVELYNY